MMLTFFARAWAWSDDRECVTAAEQIRALRAFAGKRRRMVRSNNAGATEKRYVTMVEQDLALRESAAKWKCRRRLPTTLDAMKIPTRYTEVSDKPFAEGDFGAAFNATDTHRGDKVVIKVAKDNVDASSLLREIRIMRHFTDHPHPNVLCLRDGFATTQKLDTVSLVTEKMTNDLGKVDAKDFRTHIRRIAYGILCGLECMAEAGIVHGDIKPENIFWKAKGETIFKEIKLADFGSSRASDKPKCFIPTGAITYVDPILEKYCKARIFLKNSHKRALNGIH